jgi:thioester reductase-like protein
MTYFVTGGTGFIGRNLIQRLLDNREGQIHVLVREGSTDRLQELIEGWGQGERIVPVVGDITQERLGVSDEKTEELKGKVDHFFHLAAMYDMTADADTNLKLNVGGTRNAIDFANAIEAGIFHHTSSIAAAGMHKGLFREDMFDEGQKLEHPYHRTKFES